MKAKGIPSVGHVVGQRESPNGLPIPGDRRSQKTNIRIPLPAYRKLRLRKPSPFMKFSNFITVLSILVLALPSFGKKGGPNFIIIIGDDVGWDAFGCTGMKEARTPAIDQLAANPCMMTRFYCSVSQCASAGRTLHRFAAQEQWRVGQCQKGEAYRGKEYRRPLDSPWIQGWLVGKETLWLGHRQNRRDTRIRFRSKWIEPSSFLRRSGGIRIPSQAGGQFLLRDYRSHPCPSSVGSWKGIKLPHRKSELATTLC